MAFNVALLKSLILDLLDLVTIFHSGILLDTLYFEFFVF